MDILHTYRKMVLSCFTKQCKVPLHFSETQKLILSTLPMLDCGKKDCLLKQTRRFDVIILSSFYFSR